MSICRLLLLLGLLILELVQREIRKRRLLRGETRVLLDFKVRW